MFLEQVQWKAASLFILQELVYWKIDTSKDNYQTIGIYLIELYRLMVVWILVEVRSRYGYVLFGYVYGA